MFIVTFITLTTMIIQTSVAINKVIQMDSSICTKVPNVDVLVCTGVHEHIQRGSTICTSVIEQRSKSNVYIGCTIIFSNPVGQAVSVDCTVLRETSSVACTSIHQQLDRQGSAICTSIYSRKSQTTSVLCTSVDIQPNMPLRNLCRDFSDNKDGYLVCTNVFNEERKTGSVICTRIFDHHRQTDSLLCIPVTRNLHEPRNIYCRTVLDEDGNTAYVMCLMTLKVQNKEKALLCFNFYDILKQTDYLHCMDSYHILHQSSMADCRLITNDSPGDPYSIVCINILSPVDRSSSTMCISSKHRRSINGFSTCKELDFRINEIESIHCFENGNEFGGSTSLSCLSVLKNQRDLLKCHFLLDGDDSFIDIYKCQTIKHEPIRETAVDTHTYRKNKEKVSQKAVGTSFFGSIVRWFYDSAFDVIAVGFDMLYNYVADRIGMSRTTADCIKDVVKTYFTLNIFDMYAMVRDCVNALRNKVEE